MFLSYVEGDEDRLPVIDELLRQAETGAIRIRTSVLSQVEVAFVSYEKTSGELAPAVEESIDNLWKPESPVTLVEFHDLIASAARSLMRSAIERRWSLKPSDAIHLASAQRVSPLTAFHTYDKGLPKFSELVGFPICEPITSQPQITGFPGVG